MDNQRTSTEQVDPQVPAPEASSIDRNNDVTDPRSPVYDPVKLLEETQSFLKVASTTSLEGFGLPRFFDSKGAKEAKPGEAKEAKAGEEKATKPIDAPKPGSDAAKPADAAIIDRKTDPSEAKAKDNARAEEISPEAKSARDAASGDAVKPAENKDAAEKKAAPENKTAADTKTAAKPETKPETAPLPKLVLDDHQKAIADKVISKITDSTDPVKDIKEALKKLDNLNEASVTKNGKSSHIDIQLLHGKNVAAPNISVKGFTPVQSHLSSHLSFDVSPRGTGFSVSNMNGFSSTVRGPLGGMRHSDTTSMYVGRDQYGGFINTTSDLHMPFRVRSSTTTLRENNLQADSPMRALMQHPESLQRIGSMMRMFQSTDDISKMGIKRNGEAFDVKSDAKDAKHVELNFTPEPDKNALIKVPVTVKSMDLDKSLSASLTQEKDSVTLGKISGLTVNIEIGKLKASVNPTKVSIEKDKMNLELTNPEDGSTMPVSIPISKLKEAANKLKQ